mgnify:CR=1 FL=1
MKKIKRWWWLILLIPLMAAGGFVVWAESTPDPMPEAIAALETAAETDSVLVWRDDWIVFRPTDRTPDTGLILYPGARVDPRAYAPLARAAAAEGFQVVIVPMPLNLAFFGPDRALTVVDAFPGVAQWAVGGHSLGGAMAARFAYRHPAVVEGLVLWASYPARSDDLSDYELKVVSIYGTRDGLATADEIETSRPRLPADTRWVAVEGGNHAQFGWYGSQPGDNPATISRAAQQQAVVAGTVQLLRALGE